ncbi:MAG: SDR family oxidoreductase, partial [Planctomycetota bacterium]
MNLGLDGKAVFVTGASGGIGRAIAETLALEGANVVLQGRSQFDSMAQWVQDAEWSDRALCVRADVTEPRELEEAFRAASDRFGAVYGCVVNAGVWPPEDVPLVDMDEARVRRTLEINLAGAMWTSRAFLRSIRGAGAGSGSGASLVFTGSTAAAFGEAGHSDYAASKAGLYGLMRSLKNEIVALDPYGRVNVVDPGWVVTEMTEKNLDEPGVIEGVVRTMPLQQLARPADIANAV